MYDKDQEKPSLAELAHHGIKGQKWGVIRDLHPGEGGTTGHSSISDKEAKANAAKILDYTQKKGIDPVLMKDKYGPGSLSSNKSSLQNEKESQKLALQQIQNEHNGLSVNQKKLILAGGAAALIVGLGVYGHYSAKSLPTNQKFWTDYVAKSTRHELGMAKDEVDKLSTEEFNFPAGHIFKRVSTEAETEIRPGGFFAAHNDADAERYKAILPVFWPGWGLKAESGYVNNLVANTTVKAPSHRAVYDFFEKQMADPTSFNYKRFREYEGQFGSPKFSTEEAARANFHLFTRYWADPDDLGAKEYFSYLKTNHYNAVPDMNDAGVLSDSPMRMLDGTIFKVSSHTPLSKEDIKLAQRNLSDSIGGKKAA